MLIRKGAQVNCTDAAGATPLLLSLRGGNFLLTEFLIGNEADLFARDFQGRGLNFYLAECSIGDFKKAIELLQSSNHDPFARDENGRSLVNEAVHAQNFELLRHLITGCSRNWDEYAEMIFETQNSDIISALRGSVSAGVWNELESKKGETNTNSFDAKSKSASNCLASEIQMLRKRLEESKKVG